MTVFFYFVLWLCTAVGCVPETHFFDTMEQCQVTRADYIDRHPDNPEKWVISKCYAVDTDAH